MGLMLKIFLIMMKLLKLLKLLTASLKLVALLHVVWVAGSEL